MKYWKNFGTLICLLTFILGYQIANAQQNLAQQAYTIFDQYCLVCHGQSAPYADKLTIQHTELIETRVVIPGDPDNSELYKRLLGNTDRGSQMPLGQEPLDPEAVAMIRRWIEAGASDWEEVPEIEPRFITTEAMLKAIHTHIESLDAFDRTFARYFTLTHLYNAGETHGNLRIHRNALSKLINNLSWGSEVIKPKPIDAEETILYIDLRHYEWDIRNDRWYQIERAYPYSRNFESPTYTTLRQEMDCEVPFIRADWFIATASLPPLYYEILDLPETDTELETQLEVNVAKNLKDAPGVRVWRAGFNESGVSRNNRIVERHRSQHGAYWKTYDFAGNVGTQNIFTHPLDFKHDGGEIIFNLPNGLQAYYLSNALGDRLDEAPIDIVSNAGSRDPVVRNGLSCMGCHTEGMKPFEDEVRLVITQDPDPPYDKAQALRLYTEKLEMDALIREDTQRYKQALEATGGVFGGSEPIQQLVREFEEVLDAAHAAAEVGLETDDFLQKIRENGSLQNLGLLALDVSGVKRDTWESQFSEVIFVLDLYIDIVSSSTDKFQFDPDLVPAVLSNGDTESSVRSVAFSPDGRILAIGSDNNVIQLWDTGTGKHLKTFIAHVGYVDILAFSPDGHTLMSVGTQENALRVLDVDTGRRLKTNKWNSNEPLINITSNANGRMLAASGYVAGGGIHLWDVSTSFTKPEHLKFFSGHRVPVDVIAFSPDGSTLASGSSMDRTIRLWDAATGEHLETLIGHNSGILSLDFSPDGRVLASGSDGEIRLWNASTGQHLQTLAGYTADVSCVSFSVDGRILAGGSDGEIRLWDAITGRHVKTLLVDGYVRGIDFSPDGRRLASAVAGSLYLWDIILSTTPVLTDVNGDGNVNILDIVIVSNNFGPVSADTLRVDVNADGIINIQDLVLVAGAIDIGGAAPSLLPQSLDMLTSVDVQLWLIQAQQLNLTDATVLRGIRYLEQLLVALTPKETTLLPNYPNPFNPETWIPYQLAEPADVTVSIYSVNGKLIQRLTLGHQPVGIYKSRSRAAYWDGRNALGEPVASGLYFYTLTAGDFTATRKMLIRK